MRKTNAVRILDQLKIGYTLLEYQVDESDLSAVHLAQTAGIPIGLVYKTLVLESDKHGHLVCIVPGAEEIDLKKAALASTNKKVGLLKMKDLEPLTGYIRGGCSPLGLKKPFPILLDNSALALEKIYISAGMRGMQICLSPSDLIKACNAKIAALI